MGMLMCHGKKVSPVLLIVITCHPKVVAPCTALMLHKMNQDALQDGLW